MYKISEHPRHHCWLMMIGRFNLDGWAIKFGTAGGSTQNLAHFSLNTKQSALCSVTTKWQNTKYDANSQREMLLTAAISSSSSSWNPLIWWASACYSCTAPSALTIYKHSHVQDKTRPQEDSGGQYITDQQSDHWPDHTRVSQRHWQATWALRSQSTQSVTAQPTIYPPISTDTTGILASDSRLTRPKRRRTPLLYSNCGWFRSNASQQSQQFTKLPSHPSSWVCCYIIN